MSWVRSRLRLAMALAALAWCLALLGDWLHPVVVRHVICMEHGEILDAPDPVAHHHASVIDRDPGGAHEPCAADGAPPVVIGSRPHVVLWTPLVGVEPSGAAHDAHRALDVIVNAPKTSPPRG